MGVRETIGEGGPPALGDVQGKVVLTQEELYWLIGGLDLGKTKDRFESSFPAT